MQFTIFRNKFTLCQARFQFFKQLTVEVECDLYPQLNINLTQVNKWAIKMRKT